MAVDQRDIQGTTSTASGAIVTNTGSAINHATTFSGYEIGQVVEALREQGILA